MDGPGEHYAKWNKPARDSQGPYDFTHIESYEKTELTGKVILIESRMTAVVEGS